MKANELKVLQKKIVLIERQFPILTTVARPKWEVRYSFYENVQPVHTGNKYFMLSSHADTFVTDLRKLSIELDLGFVVDKNDVRKAKMTKRMVRRQQKRSDNDEQYDKAIDRMEEHITEAETDYDR